MIKRVFINGSRMEYIPKDPQDGFRMAKITKMLGINRTTLQKWMDKTGITPSVQKAHGTGTRNLWSFNDVRKLGDLKTFVDYGFSVKTASKIIWPSRGLKYD